VHVYALPPVQRCGNSAFLRASLCTASCYVGILLFYVHIYALPPVQSTGNSAAALSKSPRYFSSALWEVMQAGTDVAMIPILAPGRSFKV